LVLLAGIAALGILSGGYIFVRTAPVVFVLAGLAIAGVWLVRRPARPSRAYLVGLIAFAAFVVWTGLSVLWSTGPDLSWVAFDVVAFYLLVAFVCGALPGGPAQLRLAAYGFAVVVAAIAGYALLGKIVPDVVTDAHVFARVSGSIGYWNVLAAIIVMAIPIALEAATRQSLPAWLRGLVSSGLAILLFTFFFTFSRGGFVALAVALFVYFILSTRRLAGLVSLAIPGVLVAAVLYHVRHLGTLFNATTNDALRTAQGHALARWVVVALVVAFAAQVLVALAHRRWPLPARTVRVVGIVVLVVLVAVPLAFGAYYFPRHGGLDHWARIHYEAVVSGSAPSNTAGRLTSLGSSGRIPWYREAIKGFRAHEIMGSGAGTFQFTNYLYRTHLWVVKHSHSEWLNVLSELGLVGFVLFVVAIGGLVVAAFGRLFKDRTDPERSLLAACQAAILVFVVHMSIDWDWDMAVITVAFLLLVGVAAAYVRKRGQTVDAVDPIASEAAGVAAPPNRRPSPAVRLLVTGLIAFGAISWALPYLSQRAVSAAVDNASRGRLTQAAASAREAGRLDPLAVDPLLTLAAVQVRQRQATAARTTLDKAVHLQPRNYETYYRMGLLELDSFGQRTAATQWFLRALALNPLDPVTRQQLGLH
jgi:O-antigen ligase